ncbi:TPA: AAA family ATPase [Salmonella enterica subsp. enterica serovar Belem]|nr:ATP-binding protein [Salmonella enterica subsp. enterica serovar Parkroyal]EJM1219806.1 ATP-binding protein [Salmonella enterica]EJU7223697.1 ATP-binding protein [Salmonella enterica]MJU51933.1 ATP-binding protein [Salmonella enterica subsp. enterica serovar Coquilhatville]
MIIKKGDAIPSDKLTAFLKPNYRWNDFGFVTTFVLYISKDWRMVRIGELKIGYLGQDENNKTSDLIEDGVESLTEGFFSLGQDPEYYYNLSHLPAESRSQILSALKDIPYNYNELNELEDELVFQKSLSRYVSVSSIVQFRDILYENIPQEMFGLKLNLGCNVNPEFNVYQDAKPPTNIHVLIGRNGVGKSHLLRMIVNNIDKENGLITNAHGLNVSASDFGLLLYFSLSIFDKPFEGAIFNEGDFKTNQAKKKYIGIFDYTSGELKNLENDLAVEFSEALYSCLYGSENKKQRWSKAVKSLEVDMNFRELKLSNLENIHQDDLKTKSVDFFKSLSSGHSAVIYNLIHIIELVENKTVCIFDEPENHLHPPLLSAFIRTLSDVLSENNGMAIIATHSPVILQEVPRSCIWKINRFNNEIVDYARPGIETFGESVGEITADVFSLDIRDSGFYALLEKDSLRENSAESVVKLYKNQIGFEGRAVIHSTFNNKMSK